MSRCPCVFSDQIQLSSMSEIPQKFFNILKNNESIQSFSFSVKQVEYGLCPVDSITSTRIFELRDDLPCISVNKGLHMIGFIHMFSVANVCEYLQWQSFDLVNSFSVNLHTLSFKVNYSCFEQTTGMHQRADSFSLIQSNTKQRLKNFDVDDKCHVMVVQCASYF